MIQFTLLLVRIFKTPITWLGVDFIQFEILLRTKLTLDFRTGPSTFQTSGRNKISFQKQFFFFAVYGLLLGAVTYSINDLMLAQVIFFTVLMAMLAMTLISEFTTVLFDHRDNYILLPRPVSHRTLLMSRLVHIQFYMGYIALALSLAPGVILAIKYNLLSVLVFFLAVGLSTWLTLVFTTFVYLMMSKIVEGERFKDIITYVQVIMGILIFAGYQLLPRIMDAHILNNTAMQFHWWTYIFPPSWLAALVRISLLTGVSVSVVILSLLGISLPLLGAVMLVRLMSRGFENILGEGSSESIAPVKQLSSKRIRSNLLKNLFCISETEKAGWNLAVATTRRDRKFKQTVYPYFGIMIVFAIVILKPDLTDLSGSLHNISGISKYFFIIIVGFAGSVAVTQLPYTDTPEAAWIYRALPIKEHAHLLSGAVKAMLIRFFLPAYLFVTILSVWLWGFNVLPQIILAGMGSIIVTLLTMSINSIELPFTQKREMQRKGSNTIIAILSLLLVGLLAALINLTTHMSYIFTILIGIVAAGTIFLIFRIMRNRKYKIAG